MKFKALVLALAVALLAMGVPLRPAHAAAYGANFQVSVTYQNVGTADATIQFNFYPEGSGSAVTFPAGTLKAGASASLAVGNVSGVNPGFKGSAVLSATQPVVATIVQYSPDIPTRLLSNGFSNADASTQQLVATVLKNRYNNTTLFSVQNVESKPVDLTVKFYAIGSTTPVYTATVPNLPTNAAKYFDAGKIAQLGTSFDGSAVVEAKLAGTNTPANAVVTVNELQTNGNSGKSFEGTAKSGAKVYMASALCKYTAAQQTHAYAVQNASLTDSVSFHVRYKLAGQADIIDGPYTLTPGGKQSIQGCTKLPAGALGAAVIERTAGSGTLVAVGKINGGSTASAFLGATTGGQKLALPYVRWSNDTNYNSGKRQRAFIAVQNIGTTNATNVRVQYVDRNGNVIGTQSLGTIPPGAKANSTPEDAGALDACGRFGEYGGGADCLGTAFGGGAIVLADSGAQLTALARIKSSGVTPVGEDYSGIPVSP